MAMPTRIDGRGTDRTPRTRELVATLEAALRIARALLGDAEVVDGPCPGAPSRLGREPRTARPGTGRAEHQCKAAETVFAPFDSSESGPSPAAPGRLTAREIEVLRLAAAGRSNRETAAALSVSERTVERHIEGIYRTIGARNRADATAYAFRHGLA